MNAREAKKIIKEENLNGKNFFRTWDLYTDEIAIVKESRDKYVVFTTDERMAREGIQHFTNESDALIEYIKRLRADKKYKEYEKKEGWI